MNASGDSSLGYKIQTLLRDKLGMENTHIVSTMQSDTAATAAQTTAYDNSNGSKLFTLDELVKKIPARIASQNSPDLSSSDDITLVLGSDIVATYNYEDVSIDDYNKAQDSQDNIDLPNTNQ